MCAINSKTGDIALSDRFSIQAGMPLAALQQGLEKIADRPCLVDTLQPATVLRSAPFFIGEDQVSCIGHFRHNALYCIEFYILNETVPKQRAVFFRWLGIQDPCQEITQSVRMCYAFGTLWIAADPRSGNTALRITYASKE